MKKQLLVIVPLLVILFAGAWFVGSSQEGEQPAVQHDAGGEVATFNINDPDVARFAASSDEKETTMPATENTENIESQKTQEDTENGSEQIDLSAVTQATLKTNMGDITVEFYRGDSPKTVENFVKLASEGFYNGTKFHRVIKDFMIQAGDPQSKDDNLQARWGTGGPGYMFDDEFNDHTLVQGSLAMANSGPDTNGSQFFIVTAASTPWLDGKHTNFGIVTAGLDIVMAIQGVATTGPDRPVEPVIIESIELK